jgi:hypothetical protein
MGGEFLMGATAGIIVVAVFAPLLTYVRKRAIGPALASDTSSSRIDLPSASLGPIERLSFTESLDAGRFAVAAETAAEELLTSLWRSAFDGATVTLNGVRLLSSKAEMVVTVSTNGKALIQSGLATVPRHGPSGRLLPVVTDPRTGKVRELMKEVPAAKRLARLTALSSMVVGAAHIIASADIAKKLKIIDGKLELLLAYRRIDQVAVLERIYTSAKELAHLPADETRRLELWRLRGELRQLRSIWRRELQFHLSNIEDPANEGWVLRQLNAAIRLLIDVQGNANRKIQGKISEGQLQLTLIEYAMRLDQVLAIGSNTVPAFERTLADELIEMRDVADLLEAKTSYITRRNKQVSVAPMLSGMRAMIEQYEAILPDQIVGHRCLPPAPELPAPLPAPSASDRMAAVG